MLTYTARNARAGVSVQFLCSCYVETTESSPQEHSSSRAAVATSDPLGESQRRRGRTLVRPFIAASPSSPIGSVGECIFLADSSRATYAVGKIVLVAAKMRVRHRRHSMVRAALSSLTWPRDSPLRALARTNLCACLHVQPLRLLLVVLTFIFAGCSGKGSWLSSPGCVQLSLRRR